MVPTFKNCGRRCSTVVCSRSKLRGIFDVMFITLNKKTHGYDHFTCAVDSFSPHCRVLSSLDESVSPTCWEPRTVFTQDATMDDSCKESDATVSLLNHRQTYFLIQLKTQAFSLFAAFLVENINEQKAVLLQQRQVLSREYEHLWEFSCNKRGCDFAPAISANILTCAQYFFVFKQLIEKLKLIQKSYVPRALRYSCQCLTD